MPAKKNSITTPLHLLQQLSHSLVAHLQKACSEAQRDAEVLLAKLEKQRGRTQEKVIKARAKLDEAGEAGKSKAQGKARTRLAELDDMLAVLQARQSETLSYLSELKRDAEQSIKLAQGITDVEKAAAQALVARDKPEATRSKAPARATKPVAKAAAAKPAAGKTVSSARPATRSKPAVKTDSAAAEPAKAQAPASATQTPVAQKPANKASSTPRRPSSKPAAAKGETATQSPPVTS